MSTTMIHSNEYEQRGGNPQPPQDTRPITRTPVGADPNIKNTLDVFIYGINANPTDTSEGLTNIYGETALIASSTPTTIVSYTVPANRLFALNYIEVSGGNVAVYEVVLNSVVIGKKNTWFNGPISEYFIFNLGINNGLVLSAGDELIVRVEHNRPHTAQFQGRILGKLV